MSIRRSAFLAYVAGLALAAPASAQAVPWLTATSGNWSDTTKWMGGNIPNAAGETAVIGIGGTYTVTQNVSGLTLDAITVTNPIATLNLGSFTTTFTTPEGLTNAGLVVANSGVSTLNGPFTNLITGRVQISSFSTLELRDDVTNNGRITVNPTAGSGTTTLRVSEPVTIGGTGEILLNAAGSRARVLGVAPGTLTLGPEQLLHGRGQIDAPLTNNGEVRADHLVDPLIMTTDPKVNNGLMRATAGSLSLSSVTITQGASGLIHADGSDVLLTTATINGGEIRSTSPRKFRSNSETSTVNSVSSNADVLVSGDATLILGGHCTNNGTLTVDSTGGVIGARLRVESATTIDGTGEILLVSGSAGSVISSGLSGSLTLGPGQSLRGHGWITAALNTSGDVRAMGGPLTLYSAVLTLGPEGRLLAEEADVYLDRSEVNGGTVETHKGKLIRVPGPASELNNVHSLAEIEVLNGARLELGGGVFTNNGTITVNPLSEGSTTHISIPGAVLIDGNGEIILNAPDLRAHISSVTTLYLTLGPGQTVRGFGTVSKSMENHGAIRADVAGQRLLIFMCAIANHSRIKAAGGALGINSTAITQFGAGTVEADGSDVTLTSGSISGGAIVSSAGGRFHTMTGSGGTGSIAATLRGVTSNADVHITNGTILRIDGGFFQNDGTLTINPTTGGTTTTLQIEGPVILSGTGEVHLNAPGTRARIGAGFGAALTLGLGQTLRGIGQIDMPFTNEGTVSPGFGIGTLAIGSPSYTTAWGPSSILDVELASTSSFDKITGGSHTINGGTVNVTLVGGYTPALFTSHTIIDGTSGSVVTGRFDSVTGPALPSPWVWKAGYTATDVVVGVTCPSDVNADFTVDILDFLDFIDDFSSCENQPAPCGAVIDADYNGDTFVDILDFLDFIDAFGSGC